MDIFNEIDIVENSKDIIYNFELFRPIDEFPGYYIGENGDVLSFVKGYPHIMKTWPNQHGHRYVGLRDEMGNNVRVSVHRLVATYFIPNPEKYPIVRHLNDIPDDNTVENLAWGTQHDNIQDSIENGTMHYVPVYCYELDMIFHSGKEAAEYIGCDKSGITMCCRGDCHSIKGYHFCYLEDRKDDPGYLKTGLFKRVRAINIDTGEEKIFSSRKEAAEELGMASSGISNVIAGRIPHVKRWFFEDVEVEE